MLRDRFLRCASGCVLHMIFEVGSLSGGLRALHETILSGPDMVPKNPLSGPYRASYGPLSVRLKLNLRKGIFFFQKFASVYVTRCTRVNPHRAGIGPAFDHRWPSIEPAPVQPVTPTANRRLRRSACPCTRYLRCTRVNRRDTEDTMGGEERSAVSRQCACGRAFSRRGPIILVVQWIWEVMIR